MRKIEQQMVQAVLDGNNWQGSNTGVFIEKAGNPYGVRAEIYLHGNHIADAWYIETAIPSKQAEHIADNDGLITNKGKPYIALNVDVDTLKAWPSVTTKSRLRALGVDLYQRKGKIYIGDEFICDAY